MQTDKNHMKVEKSISMHSHAFERLCKRQIVTDTKSRNASHTRTHPPTHPHTHTHTHTQLYNFNEETPTQVLSSEYCEIFKSTFFIEHLR